SDNMVKLLGAKGRRRGKPRIAVPRGRPYYTQPPSDLFGGAGILLHGLNLMAGRKRVSEQTSANARCWSDFRNKFRRSKNPAVRGCEAAGPEQRRGQYKEGS